MPQSWSRRHVLVAGIGLLASGCSKRGGRTSYQQAERSYERYLQPATAPAAAPRPVALNYRVQAGDTLSSISRRSGVSVKAIVDHNHLNSNLIKPGQTLALPGARGMGSDPLAHLKHEPRAKAPSRRPAQPVGRGSYTLVKRSQWTRSKVKKNHRKMNGVKRITIHHTGEHAGMKGLSDVDIVRRIERYHRDGRKWSAIGYHYLVAKDGKVYEGRPAGIQGAHVSRANSHNLGISCIGDFHKKRPSSRQLGALKKFIDDQRRKYGVSKRHIYGHRDLGSSICPGNALYAWLQSYKKS